MPILAGKCTAILHSSVSTPSLRIKLEVRALGRLRELLVRRRSHEPPDLDQDSLHGKVTFPGRDTGELCEVDLARRFSMW